MARKPIEKIEKKNDLRVVLGLPYDFTTFLDGKVRKCYPISMKNFSEFITAFGFIDPEKMWVSFLRDEDGDNIKKVIELSFRDDSIDDILENINASNFTEIFKVIQEINGIVLGQETDPNEFLV